MRFTLSTISVTVTVATGPGGHSLVSIVVVHVTREGSLVVVHAGVVIRIVVVSVGVGPMKVVVVPGAVVAAVRVMVTLLVVEELVILVSDGVRYVTPTARHIADKMAITAPVATCFLCSDNPLSHLRRVRDYMVLCFRIVYGAVF